MGGGTPHHSPTQYFFKEDYPLARLPEKSLNRWSKNKLLPVQTRPQSPYEKFVRFQDRTFGESTQPAINAISEQAHFDLKKGEFSAEAVNGSKEFDDLKRIWAREFPWNAGKYTGHF